MKHEKWLKPRHVNSYAVTETERQIASRLVYQTDVIFKLHGICLHCRHFYHLVDLSSFDCRGKKG